MGYDLLPARQALLRTGSTAQHHFIKLVTKDPAELITSNQGDAAAPRRRSDWNQMIELKPARVLFCLQTV